MTNDASERSGPCLVLTDEHAANASALKQALLEALDEPDASTLVGLDGLSSLGFATLQILLAARKAYPDLRLTGAAPSVLVRLRRCGLGELYSGSEET